MWGCGEVFGEFDVQDAVLLLYTTHHIVPNPTPVNYNNSSFALDFDEGVKQQHTSGFRLQQYSLCRCPIIALDRKATCGF